jgi:hypothetical protein
MVRIITGDITEVEEDTEVTRVTPEYSKEESGYKSPGSATFNPDHDRCFDCVHYNGDGECSVVEGMIEGEAYCEEFYADVLVAGHSHGDDVEENYIVYGPGFDWSVSHAKEFGMDIKEAIENKIRNILR